MILSLQAIGTGLSGKAAFKVVHTRGLTIAKTMASTTRRQPKWTAPVPKDSLNLPPLKVYNSLTRSRDAFVPIDPLGKKVTWYCCGPTVYDAGHLGHARNYVSTDILRRILRDYFGYDVEFVMNITDVDDKIIIRARQQHLFAKFVEEHSAVGSGVDEVYKAFQQYAAKHLDRLPPDVKAKDFSKEVNEKYKAVLEGGTLAGQGAPGDAEAKMKMHIKAVEKAAGAICKFEEKPDSISAQEFYASTEDVLLPFLDKLYGSSVPPDQYSIFSKLTQHWERHFKEDLRTLNCLPPTLLTRVTEYIPENVAFVQRIVDKGFAYSTSDGSVYFDIDAFEKAGNHYARLEPWNRNDQELLADGEGSLMAKATEKRSNADFALWKSSKPGEPSWESPWGRGRPGWHIECSVMCSHVLGKQIDIHSGGIDLAFPHHDNELAQSEAYWVENEEHQWVNYFMHMGHLSIQGSKMSKSLKNFTTIRQALGRGGGWTARALRIVFLLGGWRDRIEVTDEVITAGKSWESTVNKFFTNVRALLSELEQSKTQPILHIRSKEQSLLTSLDQSRKSMHEALCDSFDTPTAMTIIADLVSKTNIYITEGQKSYLNGEVVREIARWITQMARIFGLDQSQETIGWSESQGSSAGSIEEIATPFVKVTASFRDRIRQFAMQQDSSIKKELLQLCDDIRDKDLSDLGVFLDDRNTGEALVKFVGKEEIVKMREEKQREQEERERRKRENREREEEKRRKKEEKGDKKIDLSEYELDGEGIPVKKGGVELSKNERKRLMKMSRGRDDR